MMYIKIILKRPAFSRPFLSCFFLCAALMTTAQQSVKVQIDTLYSFAVPPIVYSKSTNAIRGHMSWQDSVFYYPLTARTETGTIDLIKLDIKTGVSDIVSIQLPDSALDPRCSMINRFTVFNDTLALSLCNLILLCSLQDGTIISQTVMKDQRWLQYINRMENHYLFGFYYNFDLSRSLEHKGMRLTNGTFDVVKEIFPRPDFSKLTHFMPNNLFCNNDKWVLSCSVSKPVLYCYDNNLMLTDSLVYDRENWRDVDNLLRKASARRRLRKDLFAFCASALEKHISKACTVQLVNDSIGYISYWNTISSPEIVWFRIGQEGQIFYLEHQYDETSKLAHQFEHDSLESIQKEHFRHKMMYANGLASENRIIVLNVGIPDCPWLMSESAYHNKMNSLTNEEKIYLNLFIYTVELEPNK